MKGRCIVIINGSKVQMADIRAAGNIRQKRKDLGLTQAQVAMYCGVSLQAYQRWENNLTKEIPEERMNKLNHVLNHGLEA